MDELTSSLHTYSNSIKSCNFSAHDFLMHFEAYQLSASPECLWPWKNFTEEDWPKIIEHLVLRKLIKKIDHLVLLVALPVCLLGSMCSVITLWNKAILRRERFYAWLFLISLLDLLFGLFYIPDILSWGYALPKSATFQHSYGWCRASGIFEGLVYMCSLISDLCILWLATERYFVLCNFNAADACGKWGLSIFGGFSLLGLGVFRFARYAFRHKVIVDASDRSTVSYVQVENLELKGSRWFEAVVLVSDIMLPSLLLLCMIFLAVKICQPIRNRRLSYASNGRPVPMLNQTQLHRERGMLNLMFVLVFLYVCNQMGYCLYAASIITEWFCDISFDSTLDELNFHSNAIMFRNVAGLINYLMESLSRSANFYLYIIFSETTRAELRKLFQKLRKVFFPTR